MCCKNFKPLLSALLMWVSAACMVAQNAPGARNAAMGGAALLNEDVWSGFHNQAGLAFNRQFSAGAYYENRFMIKELSDKGAIASLPFRNSAFGISYRSFGYSAFSSSQAALAYAMKLTEKFGAGVQINYHRVRIGENYGSANTLSFDGGFLYQYNHKLSLAAHIANPTRTALSSFNDERLPTVLRIGAGYKFSDKALLNGEVKVPSGQKTSLHSGIEYWPVKQVALRAGFNTLNTFSFGFAWRVAMLQIDAAAGYNNVLGFTPQVSLTYTDRQ